MDELKALETERREQAKKVNAGRTPKFGDKMRNPWASEQNPTRDGYFVRKKHVTGNFNAGLWYEMTDGDGKFWECQGDTMMFIDHLQAALSQPAAQSAQVPEGWKLVPLKPNQAMCQAGQEKAREWPRFPLRIAPIYQAMLNDAPQPDYFSAKNAQGGDK